MLQHTAGVSQRKQGSRVASKTSVSQQRTLLQARRPLRGIVLPRVARVPCKKEQVSQR